MKRLILAVFIMITASFTSAFAYDLRDVRVVSCGDHQMDPAPISVVKLDDPEFVTHIVKLDGESLALVLNREESEEGFLKFDFTLGSDEFESMQISGLDGAYQMTLFPRDGVVIQKSLCEVN
jgi:hypothetical protein